MGTVKRLAEEVERGLCDAHPGLRKMVYSRYRRWSSSGRWDRMLQQLQTDLGKLQYR